MEPEFSAASTAVLTIDLHRGHLDQSCATMPLPSRTAESVLRANLRLLPRARAAGLPVVHVVTGYRGQSEIISNPFWRSVADTDSTRSNVRRHNLADGPGTELMPGVAEPGDIIVTTKKRYDCFLGTDLEFVLRTLRVDTLLIGGVNTNSCVLATTIAASVRDYACLVVEECVNTMDGESFHLAALRCIERAFGWVINLDHTLARLAAA
jgi:nicotinamidase-related amidase